MPDDYFILTVGREVVNNTQPIKVGATKDPVTGIYTLATGAGGSSSSPQFVASAGLSTVSTSTPTTADGTVFTLSAGEVGTVQNLATTPLLVKLGAGASLASFNYALKAGLVADDGLGGSIIIDNYVGPVSIIKSSGSTRAIAFKQSA